MLVDQFFVKGEWRHNCQPGDQPEYAKLLNGDIAVFCERANEWIAISCYDDQSYCDCGCIELVECGPY